jgi:cytochrome c-type biogenesis protein CcmH/NrfG
VEEAIAPLERAMGIVPEDPTYPWLMGRLKASLHQTFEAKEAYRKAVELDPETIMYRASFAQILAERKEIPEAVAQLHLIADALQRDPDKVSPVDALMLDSLARSLSLADAPAPAAQALMLAIPIAERFGMERDIVRMRAQLERCLREAEQ